MASELTSGQDDVLFAWLISQQPPVFFSQNQSQATSQSTVFFSQNKLAPAISHHE
jgi:hypothetical protein